MIKNGWTKELKRLQGDVDYLLDLCRLVLSLKTIGFTELDEDCRRLIESAVIRIGGKL